MYVYVYNAAPNCQGNLHDIYNTYAYIHMYVCMYIYAYMYMYVYMYVYRIYVIGGKDCCRNRAASNCQGNLHDIHNAYAYIHMYVYIYVHTCTHMYVYIYVHIHTHTHTYTGPASARAHQGRRVVTGGGKRHCY